MLPCLLAVVVTVAAAIGLTSVAAAQPWTPQRHVELIAPNAPGGAMDSTARIVQRLWQEMKLLPVSSAVVNRSGGEHALAYTYLSQRTGDPHFLSLASPVLLGNHLAGRLSVTYTDVTPIATIMTEAYVFVVRTDSPFKSGKDMVEALKARPDSLSISKCRRHAQTHGSRVRAGEKRDGVSGSHQTVTTINLQGRTQWL